MISAINSLQLQTARIQSAQQPAFRAASIQKNELPQASNNANVSFNGKLEKGITALVLLLGAGLDAAGLAIGKDAVAGSSAEGLGSALQAVGILGMIVSGAIAALNLVFKKNILIKHTMASAFGGCTLIAAGAGLSQSYSGMAALSHIPGILIGTGVVTALLSFLIGGTYHAFKSYNKTMHPGE